MTTRRLILAGALAVCFSGSPLKSETPLETVFHFYGAEDCPPCMAFKRDHLARVRAEGQALGFRVIENIIPKTRDVPIDGVYGARDPILRRAAANLPRVYPPIFLVSRGNEPVSVHGHDWQAALKAARSLAQGE